MSFCLFYFYNEKWRNGLGSRRIMGLCLLEIRFGGKLGGCCIEKFVLIWKFRELGFIVFMLV